MQWSHCPFCYEPLVAQTVTPCYICGGWPESVARFSPEKKYIEYLLPNDLKIVLCAGCEVEEFMVQDGWGYHLNFAFTGLPVKYLRYVDDIGNPQLSQDKCCEACGKRLPFLKILLACGLKDVSENDAK